MEPSVDPELHEAGHRDDFQSLVVASPVTALFAAPEGPAPSASPVLGRGQRSSGSRVSVSAGVS